MDNQTSEILLIKKKINWIIEKASIIWYLNTSNYVLFLLGLEKLGKSFTSRVIDASTANKSVIKSIVRVKCAIAIRSS